MRFSVGVVAVFLVTSTVVVHSPATAQSNTLLQLRTGGANDRLVVDTAGGFLVRGELLKASAIIPPTGEGARMMFWPGKQAFRAGYVTDGRWDNANSGQYSGATGYNTTASGSGSFAAAYGDSATGTGSIALGYYSRATGYASSAIGHFAEASGTSSMALGHSTTASANYAMAFGHDADASGTNSVAIGNHVSTNANAGAIVIGDNSVTVLQANAANQFSVRAAGGYRLFSDAAQSAGMTMAAGGSSWSAVSDRNRKQDFQTVDGEALLGRLRSLPVSIWRYRAEENRKVRHIGPMAQDWEAAFGFSGDTTMINMSDLDGVSLAAVKALDERTRQQAAHIQALEKALARVTALEREVAELKALLAEGRSGGAPASVATH